MLRLSVAAEIKAVSIHYTQRSKSMLSGSDINVVGIIEGRKLLVLVRLANLDQTIRLRERQWLQDNGVDQAEDRRVSADTKTEDENRRDGESGRFQKESEPVTELAHGGK